MDGLRAAFYRGRVTIRWWRAAIPSRPALMRAPDAFARLPGRLAKIRRDVLFLAAGLPLHLVVVALAVWFAILLIRAPAVAPVPAVLPLAVTGALTAAQRWRYQELLGIRLPRPQAAAGPIVARWVIRWLRSPDSWRQVGYHSVAAPVLAVLELLVLGLWTGGVAALTLYAWVWAVPNSWLPSELGYSAEAAYVMGAGAVLLCAAVWLTRPAAVHEARIARALLGPGRTSELQRRVADLAQSRAGVVDAADSERRRIERDLHDGAQQRLVSLAVNLGLAKVTLTGLPDDARQVIDAAHREAKEAIAELSNLVRGLHPAVLEDRGLDAALSGLAALAPLPVRLRVRLNQRPSPAVEAVAYFVISEALTNITKHAIASRAEVTVDRIGEVLRVTVTDDGAGGADAAAGSGLAGLAKRAASVDGTFRISSPAGGPTTITVELPCEP